MQQRRLGRGLESLIEGGGNQVSAVEIPSSGAHSIIELELSQIIPNPEQPRKDFDPEALQDLASSIAEKGIIQPILVRTLENGTFQIIAGERRYRASKLAGKTTIPAIVKEYGEEETLEVALIENLQREDLNPIEEAQAFRLLIERFHMGQEQIAQKIGKNRSTVANSLRLLKLPEDVQKAISLGELSAGHARAVLSVSAGVEAQQELYRAIRSENLSVRDTEAISRLLNQGESATNAIIQARNKNIEVSSSRENGHNDDHNLVSEKEKALLLSQGATVTSTGAQEKQPDRRAPELWDMEEKLIMALGTRVQIKGDTLSGKVEINYYSMEDLERIYEIMVRQKQT